MGSVAGPGQGCPRRARMSGGREAEKQEPQPQTGSREGARGPGPTSALLARALRGRRRPLGDMDSSVRSYPSLPPVPRVRAMGPGLPGPEMALGLQDSALFSFGI